MSDIPLHPPDFQRPHRTGVHIDEPDCVVVRVRDVEPAPGQRHPRRLPEAGSVELAVLVAGLASGPGRDLAGDGIEALELVVVGVGDVDPGAPASIVAATPRGCCRRAWPATPSTSPKSKSPRPISRRTRSAAGSTLRIALDSESATYITPSRALNPLGWAKVASRSGPSCIDSAPVPAATPTRPVATSSAQSWCVPAIAIQSR